LRERKIYILVYADNMVILVKKEQEMRSLLARLERYLKEKELELNEEKTKVMKFRRGRKRKKID